MVKLAFIMIAALFMITESNDFLDEHVWLIFGTLMVFHTQACSYYWVVEVKCAAVLCWILVFCWILLNWNPIPLVRKKLGSCSKSKPIYSKVIYLKSSRVIRSPKSDHQSYQWASYYPVTGLWGSDRQSIQLKYWWSTESGKIEIWP